jgi:hypothetical protein
MATDQAVAHVSSSPSERRERHHLDPRQIGKSDPDVEIVCLAGGRVLWPDGTESNEPDLFFADFINNGVGAYSAVDALRYARQRAGFGSVPEQPCAAYAGQYYVEENYDGQAVGGWWVECEECSWARHSHPTAVTSRAVEHPHG